MGGRRQGKPTYALFIFPLILTLTTDPPTVVVEQANQNMLVSRGLLGTTTTATLIISEQENTQEFIYGPFMNQFITVDALADQRLRVCGIGSGAQVRSRSRNAGDFFVEKRNV